MLTVKPELDLPKTLELCCPQDIIEWTKSKLAGLKYISIKLHTGRQKYDQFARIDVQENPSIKDIPEEKADKICELIYRVLQYKIEELDDTANFFIQIYNRTAGGDKPSGRHITIENNVTGDRESKSYNPETIAPNILDAQMGYIQMLQDNVANMMAMWGEVMKPIIDTNQSLQAELASRRQEDYNIRDLEYTHQLRKEEREANLILERDKIRANKEKWDSTLKTINKNGALDKLMMQAANKFLGDGSAVEASPPKQVRKETIKQQSTPSSAPIPKPQPKPPTPEEIQQEEERLRKEIDDNMTHSPLYSFCSMLKISLENESIENPEDNAKKYIEETLRSSLYKDLTDLLNSENEEDAKKNLIALRNNVEPNDFEGILNIKNRLDDTQKKIIDNILNYNPGESEEE